MPRGRARAPPTARRGRPRRGPPSWWYGPGQARPSSWCNPSRRGLVAGKANPLKAAAGTTCTGCNNKCNRLHIRTPLRQAGAAPWSHWLPVGLVGEALGRGVPRGRARPLLLWLPEEGLEFPKLVAVAKTTFTRCCNPAHRALQQRCRQKSEPP
eukprot:scaffold49912_cov66-Phaeocystis_antarctica.AAC.1